MPATNITQGELLVGKMVHGCAMNCTVVPFEDPGAWYMVQFLTEEQLNQYAIEYNLIVKREEPQ